MSGYSLVELMVGLAIGLITTLAITTVFTQSESTKRVVSTGADAQTNGSLALFTIQRDAENAGYGLPLYLNKISPFQCPLTTTITQGTETFDLFPVQITDGGNGNDAINIRYGDVLQGGAYQAIDNGSAPAEPKLTYNAGSKPFFNFNVNDIVLMQENDSANLCKLGRVSNVDATNYKIKVININGINTDPLTGVSTQLANLGMWNQYRYGVDVSNNLTRTVANTVANATISSPSALSSVSTGNTTTVPVVSEIVSLQAQYGISADKTTNVVSSWVDATGDYAAGMSLEKRNLIKAIRVAVVARDGLLQKTNVSQNCTGSVQKLAKVCIWSSDANPASVRLTADDNWQRYRYRVFEVAIPIRSILWNKDAL